MIVLLRVLDVVKWLVIADALLSWVMGPEQFPRSLTQAALAPVYGPIHRVIGAHVGSIDLAPLLLLALVFGLQLLVRRSLASGRR